MNPSLAPEYRDELPPGCPPDAAEEPTIPIEVFRLVHNNPPTADDFRSQRTEHPTARFTVDECIARGLSVWVEFESARNARRLPKFKNALIARLRLGAGAGRMMQTFRQAHRTWWPYKGYDIAGSCEVMP